VVEENGKISELKCHLDNSEARPKPKTFLSWVPSDGFRAEVRVYNELFTVPEPTDLWEDELNPESEIVYDKAIVDPSIKQVAGIDKDSVDQWTSNTVVQFERMGYFVVDLDTTFDAKTGEGTLVFNRTVNLKSEGPKAQKSATKVAEDDARKQKQARDLELKAARMKIEPDDLFRLAEEYKDKYSKFDPETGIPTHDAAGTELTKSAIKKLAKEKQKHANALAAWKKSQT
jgi:tRNA synthetases class I (E and Q), anti-codon binding domain